MTIADLASLILAVVTAISLLYIARQVSVSQKQAKGQFILALDEQFAQSREITARFASEPQFRPEGREWTKVWALMSIFERVSIMVEDKILDLEIVERLWGFVLVRLIENDAVYQRLHATGAEWQDLVSLCHAIAKGPRRKSSHHRDKAFVDRLLTLEKDSRRMENPFEF